MHTAMHTTLHRKEIMRVDPEETKSRSIARKVMVILSGVLVPPAYHVTLMMSFGRVSERFQRQLNRWRSRSNHIRRLGHPSLHHVAVIKTSGIDKNF